MHRESKQSLQPSPTGIGSRRSVCCDAASQMRYTSRYASYSQYHSAVETRTFQSTNAIVESLFTLLLQCIALIELVSLQRLYSSM